MAQVKVTAPGSQASIPGLAPPWTRSRRGKEADSECILRNLGIEDSKGYPLPLPHPLPYLGGYGELNLHFAGRYSKLAP